MSKDALKQVAATPEHPAYDTLVSRLKPRKQREDDFRSPFMRDYTRILHSMAYRRLKHKTQVFFNVSNDHICTRIEHVLHVESVSHIIAAYLGLNTELTSAIAIGHDLGHAPFGHQGESNLDALSKKYLSKRFWHEQNGVRFADKLELLEDGQLHYKTLNLTYAVRDGIISHCGEVDESHLIPRSNFCSLDEITSPGAVQPATWEGCVVKLSDKISYLGRDIADAVSMGFLSDNELKILSRIATQYGMEALNTTAIINKMITDVCAHSNVDAGITMSHEIMSLLDDIKRFNYDYIYLNPKLEPFRRYSQLVITELFEVLYRHFAGPDTIRVLIENSKSYPLLFDQFAHWLAKYTTLDLSAFSWGQDTMRLYENEKVYGDLSDEKVYVQAILDYLSGMSDSYALKVFEELISY